MTDLCDDDGAEAACEHALKLGHDADGSCVDVLVQGASLRICQACQKYGSHPHPEGWVAFLDNEAGGIEIEFMQVYTDAELKKYEQVKGI